jgi:hypothetical protein
MPSIEHEIPTLSIVVRLGVAALAAMLWMPHRRAAITVPRVIAAAAVCVYGAGVIANTLLPIYVGKTGPRPPWSVFLNLVPLVNTEPRDMLENVVVFLALGVLLPVVAHVGSVLRVLVCGFLLSPEHGAAPTPQRRHRARRPHRRRERAVGQHRRRTPWVRPLPSRVAPAAVGSGGRRRQLTDAADDAGGRLTTPPPRPLLMPASLFTASAGKP